MVIHQSYYQSVLMTGGTVINAFLGLVFYALVAKNLGVSGFGQFSFVIGLAMLAAELGDLGVNSAIVKFGGGENFSKIISFAIWQRGVIFGTILLFAGLTNNLPSGFVAIGLLLTYLVTQSLLARQKFVWQIGANIFGNVLRLIFLLMTPLSAIWVFFLGTLGTFVVGLPIIIRNCRKFSYDSDFSKEVWRFCLPAAGSYSLASILAKIDVPVLYYFAGPASVGLYSSAQKLTSILAQIGGAVSNVFSPKLAEKSSEAFKHYLILSIVASAGLLLFLPFGAAIINLIFGEKYLASLPVLNLLILSFIPFFLAGPFLAKIVYHHGKAFHFLAVSLAVFIIGLAGVVFLTQQYRELGTAGAWILINTISLLLYVLVSFLLSHQTR